jgi:hypothetical protein
MRFADDREAGRQRGKTFVRELAKSRETKISFAEQLGVAERLHAGSSDPFIQGWIEVVGDARRRAEERTAPARRETAIRSRIAGALATSGLLLSIYLLYQSRLPAIERRPIPLPQLDVFGAAHAACKEYVLATVGTPATAEFAGRLAQVTTTTTLRRVSAGWQSTVSSHVDAENRFSAKVRMRFRCSITWTGTRWELDDLNVVPWRGQLEAEHF